MGIITQNEKYYDLLKKSSLLRGGPGGASLPSKARSRRLTTVGRPCQFGAELWGRSRGIRINSASLKRYDQ